MRSPAKKAFVALTAVLVLGVAASAWASPFVTIRMEAYVAGTPAVYDDTLVVKAGDVVNYRLVALLADIGTVNTSATPNKVINSYMQGTDGIGSARFNIYQEATDGIQVNFLDPVELLANWQGTGSAVGVLALRPGTTLNDIDAIKAVTPIGAPYQGLTGGLPADIVLATGQFTVMEAASEGLVRMRYLDPNQVPGTLKMNNGVSVSTSATNSDPYYAFTGLQLMPEPATMALLGLGGVLALIRRRRA